MTKYIVIICVIVASLLSSFSAGVYVTSLHYNAKIHKIEKAQEKAQSEHQEAIRKTTMDYKKQLSDANISNDGPVIKRVFVKADCMPAATDGQLDDGAAAARVELERATVRSIERVISDKEKQYRECSYRLEAFQKIN